MLRILYLLYQQTANEFFKKIDDRVLICARDVYITTKSDTERVASVVNGEIRAALERLFML